MRTTAIVGSSILGKGPWRPGKKVTAIALLGGCEIDFREAELEEGVTEVTAISILGEVSIVVNPDIPVTMSGISLGGTRWMSRFHDQTALSVAKKSIHIKTLCIIGGCFVGESSKYYNEWNYLEENVKDESPSLVSI